MAKTSTRERSTWLKAVSLCAAIVIAPASTSAAPLEPEACAALSAERTQLLGQGVEADMAKGAAWARQNLAEDRLALIKKLIEVNEQLSFRCGIMVTERPTLIQRVPPPATLTTTTIEPDGAEKPKKQTKSKPKTEASAPPGVPGAKKKPKPAEASASPKKPVEMPKAAEAEKQPAVEKSGN